MSEQKPTEIITIISDPQPPKFTHVDVDGDRLLITTAKLPDESPGIYFRTDPEGSAIPLDRLPELLEQLTEIAIDRGADPATRIVMGVAPKALPDGFERTTCVTIACAVCGYRYDEAEFVAHYPSAEDAMDGPRRDGWDVLKDGRVLCMSGEEKHDELRQSVGLVNEDT